MPRGQYTQKTKLDLEEQALVPPQAFNTLAWWEKLNQEEQNVVLQEGRALGSAMLQYGTSRLAIGEHLAKLQGILEPHNLFGRFLKNFHFNKRTAYRYIAGYKNAQGRLPDTVLKAAIVRGMNIIGDSDIRPLGIYTQAVEKLPPPKDATEEQARTYLDQLDIVRKQDRPALFTMPEPQDPQTLLKECYRFVSLRYKRLPTSSKTRSAWVRQLVGMLLVDLGVSGQQTFAPQAIPDDFKKQRGRPVAAIASA